MKEKLKPCPFCGGKARLYTYGFYSGLGPDLVCLECPAKMRCKEEDEESIKKLIKAWNKRPE